MAWQIKKWIGMLLLAVGAIGIIIIILDKLYALFWMVSQNMNTATFVVLFIVLLIIGWFMVGSSAKKPRQRMRRYR